MNRIFVYTSYYPYSTGECFLAQELEIAYRLGVEITIIPIRNSVLRREVPSNVYVDDSICHSSTSFKMKSIFTTLKVAFWILKDRDKKGFNIKDYVKYSYATSLVLLDVKTRAKHETKCIFYSYWLSYAATSFALYKKNIPYTKHIFIARGHGSDIYCRDLGLYYPLRDIMMKQLDYIFLISDYGKSYLAKKYINCSNKLFVSRLGVFDNYIKKNKDNHNSIRIVSCSSVIPIKRVDLIQKSLIRYALQHPKTNYEWVHFGDGLLMDDLKTNAAKSPNNLTCVFKGLMQNVDILKYYRDNVVDCFVLLSTTEGIPVSAMEAIASGIPILATDVGGVREIVNIQTGRLLAVDFAQNNFTQSLDFIISNYVNLSVSAHNFFQENYCAERNYRFFYNELSTLLE